MSSVTDCDVAAARLVHGGVTVRSVEVVWRQARDSIESAAKIFAHPIDTREPLGQSAQPHSTQHELEIPAMQREQHLRLNDTRACERAYGFAPSATIEVGDRSSSGRPMA